MTATVPATGAGEPARCTAWREVEVELGDGDADLAAAVGERLGRRVPAVDRRVEDRPGARRRLAGSLLSCALGRRSEPANAGESVLGRPARSGGRLQAADSCSAPSSPAASIQIRIAAAATAQHLRVFRARAGPCR